jgi:N-acetylglutamate synthase-like GNAT family acetyltransferase
MSSEDGASYPLPPGYEISTDKARIDVDFVHRYLSEESYWSAGISLESVERALANSLLNFGVFGPDGKQVGFARVTGDGETFAYIADVFIATALKGRGLGKALMTAVLAHPYLKVRRVLLATMDAHSLYAKFDFQPMIRPDRFLERLLPGVREKLAAAP